MEIKVIKTETDFFDIVKNNKYVVVDFFSTDCPPCEKLAPIFERLAIKYTGFQFIKIHRQENRPLAQTLGVSGSPTLLFYINGELQNNRLSGEIAETDFVAILEKISPTRKIRKNKATSEIHDLCIIGTGPAGLTAAVYASRYKIDHVLVGELTGGLMTSSHKICNYPSEIEISGMDLTKKMWDHVNQLQTPFKNTGVTQISKKRAGYELVLSNEEVILTKTILLATGTKHKHLNIENESKLIGRGISYCATCDAAFYTNKTVAVIGGSDSASTAALYLADIAKDVYQIYRGEELRGETAWIDQVKNNLKIKLILNSDITSIQGDQKLESIEIKNISNEISKIVLDGLFVEIGSEPDPILINQLKLKTDEKGYIKTKADQTTNKKGIWAAGDITTGSNSFRQIVTACSEGAIATQDIFKYLKITAL
ncbi:MAG: FAD-dependent oxidoreductase [Patescibacteria group bacterium]|jgi:thioredoxin reductase (NADPH)